MLTSLDVVESSGMRRAPCDPTKLFQGHTDIVRSVAYFPDGRHIASASRDKTIIIWNVESGRQDGQPLQHDFDVWCIAVSPDGRRIASGIEGGLVVWDALTREVVHEIKGDGAWKLAYSPDGRWIATAPVDVVHLWDANSCKPGREPLKYDGSVLCLAFSPDGTRIAAGLHDGSFQVIDISTGKSVVGPIKGHTRAVESIVYSPDGRLLITASWDQNIRIWYSKTGVEAGKPMVGHDGGIDCISITADGRRIATGGFDKTVRVWDLEAQVQVGDSFNAHCWVRSVAFSSDGRYIISGAHDGAVSLCDTESLAIQGPSSPPTATPRIPPAPITQPVPPLRQQRKARAKSHNDSSSITSSLLDLPAVIQRQHITQRQQERKPSVDDDWDTEPIRPRLRPTEPQQDPPRKQDTLPVQPPASGHKWSRNICERWRHIRHRKRRVPTDISDGPAHLPLPIHERTHAPASTQLSTKQPVRREKAANAQRNAQGAHTRTRSSRNQIEANVAFAQDDVRLVIAAPRGREGRRFRARAQRGGVRADSHSDTESEDSDAESEYADTGCLNAICYWVYFGWRRYSQRQ